MTFVEGYVLINESILEQRKTQSIKIFYIDNSGDGQTVILTKERAKLTVI